MQTRCVRKSRQQLPPLRSNRKIQRHTATWPTIAVNRLPTCRSGTDPMGMVKMPSNRPTFLKISSRAGPEIGDSGSEKVNSAPRSGRTGGKTPTSWPHCLCSHCLTAEYTCLPPYTRSLTWKPTETSPDLQLSYTKSLLHFFSLGFLVFPSSSRHSLLQGCTRPPLPLVLLRGSFSIYSSSILSTIPHQHYL